MGWTPLSASLLLPVQGQSGNLWLPLPGGGVMPGGGGGASVPSAVSGPSTPFHGHRMPVVWLDACLYIYVHDCVMRAMGFCAGAQP